MVPEKVLKVTFDKKERNLYVNHAKVVLGFKKKSHGQSKI